MFKGCGGNSKIAKQHKSFAAQRTSQPAGVYPGGSAHPDSRNASRSSAIYCSSIAGLSSLPTASTRVLRQAVKNYFDLL